MLSLRPCESETRADQIVAQTCVIIPALNEEAALPRVLADLRHLGLDRIRVVDNGSHDHTAQVARQLGAEVLSEARRGYGAACWCGMSGFDPDVEWVLFCDADGSDELSELPRLFAQAALGADFVIGNRRGLPAHRAALTPQQDFGNALAVALIEFGWGHRYHDLGPLRLIHRGALDRIAMQDRGFGWTVEMQVRAVEEGLRIVEVPVRYRQRRGGRSKISGTVTGTLRAGSVILFTIGRLWLRRLWRGGKRGA
jgi:glycosyltransferase involved in cell wall biosynthesis